MSEDTNRLETDEPPILIDFQLGPGVYDVGRSSIDITQKSIEALNQAMHVIQHMARRVVTTVQTMPRRPSEIEVDFGIVFNTEVGALISKAGAEASINVKLVFASDKEEKQ